MTPADPEQRKKRIWTIVRLVAALAILAFVASKLPWTDHLEWQDADETAHSIPGEIEGDWKSSSIVFRPSLDAKAPAGWEGSLRPGEPLELERGQALAGGTADWKPGMIRAFREMDPSGLGRAMALFTIGFLLVVTRWWRLLALAGCPTSWFNALRLTFLGMFFNLVVPGLTGGDLVKAVVVAKENPGRRADALVSVIVDRALGLGTLMLIAAVVIVVSGDTFAKLRMPVLLFIGAGVLGAFLYVNPTLRRVLRVKETLMRLPAGAKIQSVDRSVRLYFKHPLEVALAIGFSLANHVMMILGVAALGAAIGMSAEVGLREYFVVVPVANIISSLPLAPGGWGLGEAAYGFLFQEVGASAALGVAVSVTFRLCQLAFGLVGGGFLLMPGSKAEVREVAASQTTPEAPA